MIDLYPTKCNLCKGKVIYTTNDKIYGRRYENGYCYVCTKCGAYVGTHKPWPRKSLGLLANKEMREMKMKCHDLFDVKWKNDKKAGARNRAYCWLASKMGIEQEMCHFGYFNLDQLKQAYKILSESEGDYYNGHKNKRSY